MQKLVNIEQAVDQIKSGSTIMIGGFMSCGTPPNLIEAILARDIKDLTVISNDHGMNGTGISKLVAARRIKKAIATHLGLNPETGVQMNEGFMEVQVMPQGTFCERIRCGGGGLGGVLTPTGVGTVIEEGKQKMVIDGRTYLLERPWPPIRSLSKSRTTPKNLWIRTLFTYPASWSNIWSRGGSNGTQTTNRQTRGPGI